MNELMSAGARSLGDPLCEVRNAGSIAGLRSAYGQMMPSSNVSRRYRFCFTFLLGTMMALAQARSCPVPIQNASFEQDAIGGGNAPVFQIRQSPPSGWQYVTETSFLAGLIAPKAEANMFYPAASQGIDGDQAFFVVNGECRMRQVLNVTLQPHTTYTLSVLSGTRSGLPPFGGHSVYLTTTSGALVGGWSAGRKNLATEGNFEKISRTFTTGPNPPGQGESLQVTVGQPAGGEPNGYTDLDQISLTATPSTPRAANTPIDVFFVVGQSNAHGWRANSAQLSSRNTHYKQSPAPNALLAYAQRNLTDRMNCVGSMARLGTQGSGFDGNFDGFGPELSMGTDLARVLGRPVAVIKYTIGSASLAGNFKKNSPAAPDPATHLYSEMLGFINDSLQELRDQGYSPSLKALFWLQGEGDTDTAQMAADYASNIKAFVQDLRSDLSAPNLKVFLTEINGNTPVLAARPALTAQVNSGLSDLAAEDPHCYFIETSDIVGGFADGIHYSADQTIDIGQRWAQAYNGATPLH